MLALVYRIIEVLSVLVLELPIGTNLGHRTPHPGAPRKSLAARRAGGYRAVAIDTVGFFRPRLKHCATKHYLSQAGTALPAIPFGLIAAVGAVGTQTVPVLRGLVAWSARRALTRPKRTW